MTNDKDVTETASKKAPPTAAARSPLIIGVGASAGGLEALEGFLRRIPEKSGLAVIVVQHLDPTRKGMLVDILGRATSLQVRQARDRMKVQPNSVYVIPPNKNLSLLKGVLYLFESAEPHALWLPIDFFFRSLAQDCQGRSVGVILSGMGTDGTLGLKAIKEQSGLVAVQDPASAGFDSMPRSAITAGLADIIAPAEELPGKILAFLQRLRLPADAKPILQEKEKSSLEKIVILLRNKTGQDFSLYKENTLYRRVERRMAIHQLDRLAAYVHLLQSNSQELELLFKELLIGVTSFFRDPEGWDFLAADVLPQLLEERPEGGVLRAWSAGCSTGEEAYSLAMVFKETLERLEMAGRFTLRIFATDLDQDAIARARLGCYPVNICADVSPERLRRFFVEEANGYRINTEIREMLTFATQNVILDPPFTKLDILVCRNLLIYLRPEMQKRLLALFHYSLNAGGVLCLGNSETVGTSKKLFSPINDRLRIYRRIDTLEGLESVVFPTQQQAVLPDHNMETVMMKPATNLQALAEHLLLQNYSPPAVLVNVDGDILYVSGRTGRYLEPAAGRANWNIFAMAREGLRFELGSAFQKAVRNQEAITVKNLKIAEQAEKQSVDLSIQPIEPPGALQGLVLIVFRDSPALPAGKASGRVKPGSAAATKIAELEQDLRRSRDELQEIREAMQSSQEELTSTNEELQSTNEELQSTNEELTTSKEEMQSMNEELQSVNAEQQAKIKQYERISSDMDNLLNSTDIITVFLDNELRFTRYTSGANKLFRLIPDDVGRPLADINCKLLYPDLAKDAQEVLETLLFSEKQVTTSDARWFIVRIMPYRTQENRIEGLVLTFTENTDAKRLEHELNKAGNLLRGIVDITPMLMICLSEDGEILEFNPAAERSLGYTREEVLGKSYYELFLPDTDRARVQAEMTEMLASRQRHNINAVIKTSQGRLLNINWSTGRVVDAQGNMTGIIAVGQEGGDQTAS